MVVAEYPYVTSGRNLGRFMNGRWRTALSRAKSGKECSIDRIDSDGNYEPSNCRWVTNREQQKNKKTTKLYCFDGKSQLISEWAKEFGVTESMIRNQIWLGKTPSVVLSVQEQGVCGIRTLNKNKQPIYATFVSKTEIVDEYENATGEYKITYSAPVKAAWNECGRERAEHNHVL